MNEDDANIVFSVVANILKKIFSRFSLSVVSSELSSKEIKQVNRPHMAGPGPLKIKLVSF